MAFQNISCQPPKSPYHKNDFTVCSEPSGFDPLFMENVNDIADTLTEIMIVCGIHRCKAKASRGIVVKAFQFYDIKRHRCVTANSKTRICRANIVNDFERVSSMTRIEALLAYCIVKRAVKAFYSGTPDHSLYNPVMEAVIIKENEFIWSHAARRTIMIFERYEQMFFEAQLNYAAQIAKMYTELHTRLKCRADPVVLEDFHPRGCVMREVIGTRSPPKSENKQPVCVEKCEKIKQLRDYIENLPPKCFPHKSCLTLSSPCPKACPYHQDGVEDDSLSDSPPPKKKKQIKNVDLNLPRCNQCNCPEIICVCKIEPDTGILAIDCSQGPFQCQWMRMDACDKEDPYIQRPEYHQCPVDCEPSENPNDSDSTDYCECSAESNKDEDEGDGTVYNESGYWANEEHLQNLMPMDLPRKHKSVNCNIRKISKLPLPKCKGFKSAGKL